MSFKTMLVHLDLGRNTRQRLDLAFTLVEKYDAHLVGFFGLAKLVVPAVPEGAPVLIEAVMGQRRAAAERAAAEFHDKMHVPRAPRRQGDARAVQVDDHAHPDVALMTP